MKIKPIIWIIGIMILADLALAIGISPAENIIDFSSGKTVSFNYYIVNNEKSDMNVAVSASGELADAVALESSVIHVSPSEEMKPFKVTLNMPKNLTPGEHSLKISVSEAINPQSGGVVALVRVSSKIIIKVPIPAGYNASNASTSVAGAGGAAADTAKLPSESLEGGVEITGFQKFFIKGKVNEFPIEIENKKGILLGNVYAVISIEGIGTLQSSKYILEPYQSTSIITYWDTRDVPAGEYAASITLYYGNYSGTKYGKVSVVSEEEYEQITTTGVQQIPVQGPSKLSLEDNTIYLLLTFGVLLIIFINLAWYFFFSGGSGGQEKPRLPPVERIVLPK